MTLALLRKVGCLLGAEGTYSSAGANGPLPLCPEVLNPISPFSLKPLVSDVSLASEQAPSAQGMGFRGERDFGCRGLQPSRLQQGQHHAAAMSGPGGANPSGGEHQREFG